VTGGRLGVSVRAAQRGVARRAGWGVADQALSSVTNFAIGLLVARSISIAEFGAFSLALAAYRLSLNASRALATEPLGVRFSQVGAAEWRRATQAATGLAATIGLLAALVCLGVGVGLGDSRGDAFVALALWMPSLLVQDAWRYAFFAIGRGGQAFLNDLVWAVALVPSLGILVLAGNRSTAAFMLAWGGAGGAAAVAGIVQARVVPDPRRTLSWLREQGDLSSRYLFELLAVSGSLQLSFYGIGAIAGLAAVGTIRAAELLLGPLNVLTLGVGIMAVPEAARALRVSLRRLMRVALVTSGVLTSTVLIWGVLILVLPTRIGVAILGGAWAPGRQVVTPLIVLQALNAANTGAFVGLRALAAVHHSVRARLFASICFVTGALAGAAFGGALGAAWGLALAAALNDIVWWRQLRLAARGHRQAMERQAAAEQSGPIRPPAPVAGRRRPATGPETSRP
jgi:O-antigen/teichoic acid export membrane protein